MLAYIPYMDPMGNKALLGMVGYWNVGSDLALLGKWYP
jgi:hypothetical protein